VLKVKNKTIGQKNVFLHTGTSTHAHLGLQCFGGLVMSLWFLVLILKVYIATVDLTIFSRTCCLFTLLEAEACKTFSLMEQNKNVHPALGGAKRMESPGLLWPCPLVVSSALTLSNPGQTWTKRKPQEVEERPSSLRNHSYSSGNKGVSTWAWELKTCNLTLNVGNYFTRTTMGMVAGKSCYCYLWKVKYTCWLKAISI
jgi:hypothetical protein